MKRDRPRTWDEYYALPWYRRWIAPIPDERGTRITELKESVMVMGERMAELRKRMVLVETVNNRQADRIAELEEALKGVLLDIDFTVERGVLSDIRNDIIYENARRILKKGKP